VSAPVNRPDYTNIPLPTPPKDRRVSDPKTESAADKIKRVVERQRRESTPHPSKFTKIAGKK